MTIKQLNEKGIPFAILKSRLSIGAFTTSKAEWILIVPQRLHRHTSKMYLRMHLTDPDVISKQIKDELPYAKEICTHEDKVSTPFGSVWGFNGFKSFINGDREKEMPEGKELIKL